MEVPRQDLFEKLKDQQDRNHERIADYAQRASETFENFTPGFSSTEKYWSIPWLNEFGAYIAANPGRHSEQEVAFYIGEGLVRYHGGRWGVMDPEGDHPGVFNASGTILSSVQLAASELRAGAMASDFGFLWLHEFLGDLDGPVVDGAGIPLGAYRDLLFHDAVRAAFAQPDATMDEVIRTAINTRGPDAENSRRTYLRAVELGLEPVDRAVNETLVKNGRAPLR